MIIVREWAGLGNQLFLYAYYRSLQEKGQAAKLDISYFDTINPHGAGYQIDKIFPNSKNVYATALDTIIQVFTDMRRECLTLESSAAA